MTGEDHPSPGILVFQAMFFVSLQVVGTSFALECPCPSGPRNWGQSAFSEGRQKTNKVKARKVFRMVGLIEGEVGDLYPIHKQSGSISKPRKSRAQEPWRGGRQGPACLRLLTRIGCCCQWSPRLKSSPRRSPYPAWPILLLPDSGDGCFPWPPSSPCSSPGRPVANRLFPRSRLTYFLSL